MLFWDQTEEKIYSDKYIRIEEEDRIITGIGFESNQDMTQYKIFDSQGVFPVSESTTTSDSTLVVQAEDTIVVEKQQNSAAPVVERKVVKSPDAKLERKLKLRSDSLAPVGIDKRF